MKIAIIGSGVSACLASWALRRHEVTMISPSGKIGGQWASGPIRIARPTQALVDALEWSGSEYLIRQVTVGIATIDDGRGVGVDAEDYVPHGDESCGYLLKQFEMLPSWSAKRLEMPDPVSAFSQAQGSELASVEVCDPFAFMQAAADDCEIIAGRVAQIRPGWIATESGDHIDADMVVVCAPVESLRVAIRRSLPRSSHGITSLWWLPTDSLPPLMMAYDVVHVATTRASKVFRVSNVTSGYWIEASGFATRLDVIKDCSYLGFDCADAIEARGLIPGAPCGTPPDMHSRGLRFLGPLARCDANECAGTTAVRAMALAEEIDR